jgi:hypothetical protein
MFTVAPELGRGVMEGVKEVRRRGGVVAIGHRCVDVPFSC